MPDTAPPPTATQLVERYLRLMEARDFAAAGRMLAPGFSMVFPPGRRFERLEDVAAWARPRYQWVKKRFERFDEAPGEGGATIVYSFGRLYGVWPDGAAFDGIRYIDRFTVKDGLLVDQMVWNDMGETKLAARP